jgi:hypothetical protein
MALSEHLKILIQKARIMDFQGWSDRHSPEMVTLFQSADDGKLYLTDDELTQLKHLYPERGKSLDVVQMLRDHVVEIVDEARAGFWLASRVFWSRAVAYIRQSEPMPAGGIFGSSCAASPMGLQASRLSTPANPGYTTCGCSMRNFMCPSMPWSWV